MRIVIYSVECYRGHEHLMPWRTVLEVAKVIQNEGHEVYVLNACYDQNEAIDFEWDSVKIRSVLKKDTLIVRMCNELKPEVLFIPFTFRDGLKPAKWIAQVGCRKVGYMAGGVYDFQSGWFLRNICGLMAAKPYLMEAITPKFIFANTLKMIGVSHVVGLTDASSKSVANAGFKNVTTIYPGKDPFDRIVPDNSLIRKYGLEGKKWLLFSGAPAPTRGADVLLQAVDQATDDSIRVVMLMRTDVGSQYEKFEDTLAKLKHPERVQIIKEKVTREQLRAFFGEAWYALLPFIVIPSEVPLTYFELLSCGTPVITFKNGGTTEYLKDGLLVADKSVKGLAKALDEAWADKEKRERLSINGNKIMAAHPTWEQVGKEWIKLLK